MGTFSLRKISVRKDDNNKGKITLSLKNYLKRRFSWLFFNDGDLMFKGFSLLISFIFLINI